MPCNLVHQPSDLLFFIESEWYCWSLVKGVPRVEHNKMAVAETKNSVTSSKSPNGKSCSQLVSNSVVMWTIIKVAEAC